MIKTAQKLSDYISQILSSTVMIESYQESNVGDIGAGFFVSPRIVLTCAHVLGLTPQNTQPALKSIVVVDQGNKRYYAQIIDFDVNLDISILYVNIPSQENSYFLNLGNSSTLKEGEGIVSIGSPLGYKNTVSYGIISNTNLEGNRYFLMDIRTNPGNSGGLVYSLEKQAVVGLAVAVLNSKNMVSEGLSIGIAIDPIKEILKRNKIRFVYNEKD